MDALKIKPAAPAKAPAQIQANDVALYCPGSLQEPVIKRGKPHCPICGEQFHWYDLVDRVQFVPEH